MKIVKKPLINDVFQYEVILFGMGINNSMNNGFAREIKVNFPNVHEEELTTKYGDLRKYGTIKVINQNNIVFCPCYFYKGGFNKRFNEEQVDYDSLKKCLQEIKHWFHGKKIATPILGTSNYDGNGDKDKIICIFNEIFDNEDITLYDFEQDDYDKRYFQEILKLRCERKEKVINKITYNEKRSDIEWERLYGIYKERPKTWIYKPKAKNKQIIKINKI